MVYSLCAHGNIARRTSEVIVLTPIYRCPTRKKGVCSAEIETPRAEEGKGKGKLALSCLVLLPITPLAANKVDDGGEMGVFC